MKTTKEEQQDANKRFDELLIKKPHIYSVLDRSIFVSGWMNKYYELKNLTHEKHNQKAQKA